MKVGLGIEIHEKKGKTIVQIEGRLDAANSPKLELKLNGLVKEGKKEIVIDFTGIDYLSSAGMRLLLSMTKRLSSEGAFKICAVREEVMEIIQMAGFERILNIYESQKEALASF